MTRFFGIIIQFIYNFCGNYGLAIILFTVLIKLLLLPLGIKQQKSMAKMQKLQPVVNELQKKYKNDQQRMSTEMAKLYKDNNASPLGGCLPLLIQLPILFCLINVIYNPAKYILGIAEATNQTGVALAVKAGMSFDFFGIDLSIAPSAFGIPPVKAADFIYWIIPLLATLATYLSGKISQKLNPQPQQTQNSQSGDSAASAAQMSKSMTAIMPLMTLFFTYSMPGTAALYWFISSATQTIQQVVLHKLIKVDDVIVPENKKKGGKK